MSCSALKQVQAPYDIQGRSTVLVWLRKHNNLDCVSQSKLSMTLKTAQTYKIS